MSEAAKSRISDTQIFQDIFNFSPIGIAVETFDGQPLFVNPAFCAFLGFSEEELRHKHCVDFSPAEDAAKDWALFQQLRAGTIDHYQLEKRYFRRDGSLVWGLLSISLLEGHPSPLILGMVEDITEKKKAEEARFRHTALIESSEDSIATATLDGMIVSWNPGAEQMFGYTEAEALGKPISMIVPPESPTEEDNILETLRAGGRIEHFETIRMTKAGERIHVSLSVSPIKDAFGKIIGCCGIARDITERKRAEEALRASEERLRLAQSAARIGSFEWNIRTGANTWTPELHAIYGLSSDRFERTQAAFANLVHPDDRSRVIELIQASMKTGQPTEGEWRVVWSDGSTHWITGRWQVFMNDRGEPSRVVGVNIDVTERKLAEQALADMTRKLIEAQEKERARIGRELHDDINQRLAMLSVELERLQETPAEVPNRIEELRAELRQIGDDVQALSHDLHSSKMDYLGVVAGMKSWCNEFSERQRIEIDFKSDVGSPVPLELGQILLRVVQEGLHNVVKHSGAKRVEVQLTENSGELQLTISDSGKGFDVEAALQGTGLGLTSMRERVRLVSGTMAIQSKPILGTTIRIRVPLAIESVSQPQAV